jgi:hypothetical protein
MSRIILIGNLLEIPNSETHLSLYVEFAEKQKQNRGKAHTSKLLKELYNTIKSKALGCSIQYPQTTWLGTTKDGLPKVVKKIIHPLNINDVNHSRWILSLFSLYETWKEDRCVVNLDTLTCKAKISWQKHMLNGFLESCRTDVKSWKKAGILSSFQPIDCFEDYLSMKGSPSGQSTLHAHHDAKALLCNPKFKRKLVDFGKSMAQASTDPLPMIDQIAQFSDRDGTQIPLLVTLAIPDKGPKIRVITKGNYFLQRTLKPYHIWLMNLLRAIPEDGTYVQSKAAQNVKDWTSQGIQPWCFDLTAFTDLFPILIQYLVLKEIDKERAYHWYKLLRKSKSLNNNTNKMFVFECGQPMGLFTSWAACTLAHHLVIRYAFRLTGTDFRNNYRIIGDDVAIKDPKAAKMYEELILGLGVPISRSKSITPINKLEGTRPSGELAKRYFIGGAEITPVRPYQLESLTGKGWPLLIEFILTLIDRWGNQVVTPLISFGPGDIEAPILKWVDKVHRKKFLLLLMSPAVSAMGLNPIGKTPHWWPDRQSLTYLMAWKSVYGNKISEIAEKLHYVQHSPNRILSTTNSSLDTKDSLNIHPLHASLTVMDDDIKSVYRGIADDTGGLEEIYNLGLNIELLVSMARDGKTFKDYQSLQAKRQQAMAQATLDIWSEVLYTYEYKPVDKGYPQGGPPPTPDDWYDCY